MSTISNLFIDQDADSTATMTINDSVGNTHYAEIMRQVEAGTLTIEPTNRTSRRITKYYK